MCRWGSRKVIMEFNSNRVKAFIEGQISLIDEELFDSLLLNATVELSKPEVTLLCSMLRQADINILPACERVQRANLSPFFHHMKIFDEEKISINDLYNHPEVYTYGLSLQEFENHLLRNAYLYQISVTITPDIGEGIIII